MARLAHAARLLALLAPLALATDKDHAPKKLAAGELQALVSSFASRSPASGQGSSAQKERHPRGLSAALGVPNDRFGNHKAVGLVQPGYTKPAGDECPANCPAQKLPTVHGDPMFKVAGETGKHFWVKENELVPLLTWEDSSGAQLVLEAQTFSRGATGSQWFNKIVISDSRNSPTPLVVAEMVDGHMQTLLNGTLVKGEGRHSDGLGLAHLRITGDQEGKVTVSVGELKVRLFSSEAHKFGKAHERQKYKHLNMDFASALPASASGIFAELGGIKPMSESTKALLKEPAPEATHTVLLYREVDNCICTCHDSSKDDPSAPLEYHMSPTMMTWFEADVYCQEQGMVMAEPRTPQENMEVLKMSYILEVPKNDTGHIWLGAGDQDIKYADGTVSVSDGKWTWHSNCGEQPFWRGNAAVDCETHDGKPCPGQPGTAIPSCAYTNWAAKEPNNWEGGAENCMQLIISDLWGRHAGEWFDNACERPNYAVCTNRPSSKVWMPKDCR